MNVKEHIYHEKYTIKEDYESSFEGSFCSSLSSCSSDLTDDVTSSFSSSSSSNGPLYELSELMSQLPIKRGLSKYYHGKSQTFTSLANVKSLEDLIKRDRPSKRAIKSCKSYGGGLEHHIHSPKAIISKKKNSRISLLSCPKVVGMEHFSHKTLRCGRVRVNSQVSGGSAVFSCIFFIFYWVELI